MKEDFFYAYGLSLLPWDMAAYSGQRKTNKATVVMDSAVVKTNSVAADSIGYITRVGEMAPDFTITLTDGEQIEPSALRGKMVMLQFTTSWRGVCRKEMPFIEGDIWLKHQSNLEFALIGTDRDEPLDKVIAFGKSVGVTYPLGLDPGADILVKCILRESGIAHSVLIGREGRIVRLIRLYSEEEFTSLVNQIDEMLKK